MTLKELSKKFLERPNSSEVIALKKWYKSFLFSYVRKARIEDNGRINAEERDALENYDFVLAKEIIETRYKKYLREITTAPTVEQASSAIQWKREIAESTLAPIISDLEEIIEDAQ